LYAIKRIAGFPAELGIQGHELALEELQAEIARIEATSRAAAARAVALKVELHAHRWTVIDALLTETDDEDVQ
jgi:hypothetical protein